MHVRACANIVMHVHTPGAARDVPAQIMLGTCTLLVLHVHACANIVVHVHTPGAARDVPAQIMSCTCVPAQMLCTCTHMVLHVTGWRREVNINFNLVVKKRYFLRITLISFYARLAKTHTTLAITALIIA